VAHLGKLIERLAADALGGRIGGDEFGMFGFERLQFAEQPVVFRIGNRRLVENVVGVVVALDFAAQRGRRAPDFGQTPSGEQTQRPP
jgi:hypothetical protein